MKWVSLSALIVVVLGITLLYQYCDLLQDGQAEITLQNRSTESIESVQISVFGQTYNVGRMNVGEDQRILFLVNGEGGYRVNAKFSSGRILVSDEIGYLTIGASLIDIVEIQTDKIILKSEVPRK